MPFFLHTAWLVPLFPLLGFALILATREKSPKNGAMIGQIAVGLSTVWGAMIFLQTLSMPYDQPYRAEFLWATFGALPIRLGVLIDHLTGMMLMVVTVISLMVQIYSEGYMHGDPRFSRFFAYLCLFTASMLGLTISDNYLTFLLCWEGMGLCSYLLIGFWFERPSAMRAAKKAFMTTRVGDVGMLFGVWLIFSHAGTFQFQGIFASIGGALPATAAATAALLLFCGTIGKSAQFPLHVWLPDAMEGPTPVSCLIHAATMVAAGVYLVARSYPLFTARTFGANPQLATLHWPLVGAVTAPAVVATVGGITVLLGALTAVAQSDIKRILAYSTISQLGYMVMALGVGGIVGGHAGAEKIALAASQAGLAAGMFHLMTHAYFKGLLFLGSGSVIHGAGTQNIWEMGGLRKAMPRTFWTFTIGTAALMGLPLTSGFWSKDEILSVAYHNAPLFFWVGAAGALLTAFYMTRCWTITFLGERRPIHSEEEHDTAPHAHESPASMTAPLIVLAIPALLIGFVGTPFGNAIHTWLAPGDEAEAFNFLPMLVGISMFFLGVGIGWALYGKQPAKDPLEVHAPALYHFLEERMYLDQAMYLLLVTPMFIADQVFNWIDKNVIDGIVNGVGWLAIQISKLWRWVDSTIVDGIVNLVGVLTMTAGNVIRLAQTGRIQTYLAVIVFGLLILLVIGAR